MGVDVRQVPYSPYELMMQMRGVTEIQGKEDHPLILAMLQLDNGWPSHDEVAWCSAAINFCCMLMQVERTRSLMARKWLLRGRAIPLEECERGFDIVVLKRGEEPQPGPENVVAQGHVGWFHGRSTLDGVKYIEVLGGNQKNSINIMSFPAARVLGCRRLAQIGVETGINV